MWKKISNFDFPDFGPEFHGVEEREAMCEMPVLCECLSNFVARALFKG